MPIRIVRLRLASGRASRFPAGRAPLLRRFRVKAAMPSHIARGDRRRRVLHDEVRSAALHAAANATMDDGGRAPRYGEQACVEHHPQITDYVPRRKRAVLVTLAGGALVAAAAEAMVHSREAIALAIPGDGGANRGPAGWRNCRVDRRGDDADDRGARAAGVLAAAASRRRSARGATACGGSSLWRRSRSA